MSAAQLAAFILFAFVSFSALDARADETADAGVHFNEGVARLEAKDYAAAAAAFERSLQIKESLPALFNLAVAYKGANRFRDSKLRLEHFVTLLENQHAPPEALARARALLDEVKKKLARVRITVAGGATSVSLGDEEVAKRDGAYLVDVDPGRYTATAKKEGVAPAVAMVNAVEGELADVLLKLPEASASDAMVRIVATPDAAQILIDGLIAGQGRSARKLPAGAHTIEVVAPDYQRQVRLIRVEPGVAQEIEIALQPEPDEAITAQWWFWAGLAAIVVAGTATGVAIAASRDPTYDCGNLDECLFGAD